MGQPSLTARGPVPRALADGRDQQRRDEEFFDPRGGAISVLCADWGLDKPGRKPEPKGAVVGPPPRIRLWALAPGLSPEAIAPHAARRGQIDPPAVLAPTDWSAFCSERKGWRAVTAESDLSQDLCGGCAVENAAAVLLLFAGRPNAVLVPKPATCNAIRLTLLDSQGNEAEPVKTIRVLSFGPDEAVLESSSPSAAAAVKATWTIGGSRALVQVAPQGNANKLRIEGPMEYFLAPDRFGNDLVADPEAFGRSRTLLPWAPLVMGLLDSGSDMLVLVCPEQGQRAELQKGMGLSFMGADVALQDHAISVGVVTGQRTWHLQRFAGKDPADPLRFKWRMPCPAAWRLYGARRRAAVCGVLLRQGIGILRQDRRPLPQEQRFPRPRAARRDLPLRPHRGYAARDADALGPRARCARAEDRPAGVGRGWADRLSQVRPPDDLGRAYGDHRGPAYLFRSHVEVQDGDYARRLCDDLVPFVEGMDQRLQEYADFARNVDTLCMTTRPGAAVAKLRYDLTPVVKMLAESVSDSAA